MTDQLLRLVLAMLLTRAGWLLVRYLRGVWCLARHPSPEVMLPGVGICPRCGRIFIAEHNRVTMFRNYNAAVRRKETK